MTSTTMTTLTMMTTGLELVADQTRTTASTISISVEDQRAFAWRGAGDSKLSEADNYFGKDHDDDVEKDHDNNVHFPAFLV